MKKIAAIVLLSLHLFYLGGYMLVFQYFIHRSDVQIVKELYSDKPGSEKLIQLKVPVHMPTLDDWTDYANIQGQIQLNDNYYNYVRLKMTKDTMYLICLPNNVKSSLTKANIILAKNLNDVPFSKKGTTSTSSTKKAESVYDNFYHIVQCDYEPIAELIKNYLHSGTPHLSCPYIESPGKPPNTSC